VEAGSGKPTPSGEEQRPTEPVTPPTPEQRIEGVRAWVAQIDRKLGIRTYAGAAAIVLALAAGIVGGVLAVTAKDESATKEEVTELRNEVETGQREATEATEDEVASVLERLDALESRVSSLASSQRTSESELQVAQDDIDELRNQVANARNNGGNNP
jgi:uncharacterized protein HemX